MAMGVPVLITNKVNIWREAQLSGSGRVVADEVDEIAESLQHMCRLPQSQLKIMEKARETAFWRALISKRMRLSF
jgi:hypothetical protein